MSFIRTLMAGIAAASIATPVFAQACLPPAERAALDVRAVQSQLMVIALSCGQHDDYNLFVTKYKSALGTAYNGVRTHFSRNGGQRSLDNYITSLANAHSQAGIAQGTLFCQNSVPFFQAALAQTNAQGIAALATQYNLANPISTPACAVRQAPATVQASRSKPAAQPIQTAQASPVATR